MNLLTGKKAFTLVELVIAMGLFAILIGTTTMMLFTSLKNARKSAVINRIKTDGAFVLDMITKDVRYASAVACTATSLTLTRSQNGIPDTIVYSLDIVGHQIEKDGVSLTSDELEVTTGTSCMNAFECAGSEVAMCFVVNSKGGVDVSDSVAGEGMVFKTRVVRRN
jgi:prepilin-type N-terminal cleavage/methylation domain-containing protein